MKIGIDARSLQERPWGGVGQYTYRTLQALFSSNRENEYHLFYNAWNEFKIPSFDEFSNVHVHRFRWPSKLLNLCMKVFGWPKADRMMKVALDTFFIPNLNFIALSPQIKRTVVAHDLSFEHFPEFFSLKSRLWHQAVRPRAFFKNADEIIAVSQYTKDDLVRTYGIAQEKIRVEYPIVKQMKNEELRIKNEQSYILYFGALEPRKNIEGIIGAYELCCVEERQVPKLVLAGRSTFYVTHIKKRIARSRWKNNIALIENPTEEHKAELYAAAQVFVYPSFYEGFGFPPLEAMSCGVPVVASSASSIPEVCGNKALLVNPWDVSEIKQGIAFFLRS